jgi:hypothetical protein
MEARDRSKTRRRDILAGRSAELSDREKEKANKPKIEGSSIGGAGAGPGTGESDSSIVRPASLNGTAVNDYTAPLPKGDRGKLYTADDAESEVDMPHDIKKANPRSGFPGGGAVRTNADRTAAAKNHDVGFTPDQENEPKAQNS